MSLTIYELQPGRVYTVTRNDTAPSLVGMQVMALGPETFIYKSGARCILIGGCKPEYIGFGFDAQGDKFYDAKKSNMRFEPFESVCKLWTSDAEVA